MRSLGGCLLLLSLALLQSATAQEGHPVVGTWQGDFGADGGDRSRMVLVMRWDGERISGVFNPGRNSAAIENARLDSSTWTLRFELEMPDDTGALERFIAEGRMENIGSYSRTLTGTWRRGDAGGDFALTRHGL